MAGKIKQAMILAGGIGERLRPLTNDRPKPMVHVLGKPFAHHLIELLKKNGIEEVVFLSGYLHEKIREYFKEGSGFGIKIRYSPSPISDETGTRVRKAKDLAHDRFLLLYGDNYWPLDLEKMENFFETKGALVSMAVYRNNDARGEYGPKNNLVIDDNSFVTYYGDYAEHCRGVDIGFFIVDKKALEFMPKDNHVFQAQFLPEIIKRSGLVAYQTDHPYQTITSVELLTRTEKFLEPKKVVFLDRDGVINNKRDDDYVKSQNEFEFLPYAIESMRMLHDAGYKLYVVTNQRGIASGIMTEADLASIHAHMERELQKNGVYLSGIYYCPHQNEDACLCRKPKAGMLYRAAWEHHIDLTNAFMVGDKDSDIQAGTTAGCITIRVGGDKSLRDATEEILRRTQ